MNKILSIIVPTYNMEAYLPQCLDSLLITDFPERLDVIIVNDGSTDESSSIAHHYQKKYPEIFRVIDKRNGNYGSCINASLPVVKGKFVKILDADDSYRTENLNQFLFFLEGSDADLVITDFIEIEKKGNKEGHIHTFPFVKNTSFSFSDISIDTYIGMHAVTYKTEIFNTIDYHQTEGVSYTDVDWIFHPMSAVNRVYYYPHVIYQYLYGREGQTADFEVRMKRINHIEKSLFNELKVLQTISKENQAYSYMDALIKGRIKGVYLLTLLNKQADFDLVSFDNKLKKQYPLFYESASNVSLEIPYLKKKIYIISLWRKYKSKKRLRFSFMYNLYLFCRFIKKHF